MSSGPRQIEFVVDAQGNSTLEAKNFAGKGCVEATKVYEDALGTAEGRDLKPEYHEVEDQHLRIDTGDGE